MLKRKLVNCNEKFVTWKIEKNVQKHVTEFFGKFSFLTFHDGVAEFVHFLKSLRSQRFICLFAVPGTFLPEFIQYIQNTAEGLKFFFSCMHIA